jgi:two-component sensor histidine kinase
MDTHLIQPPVIGSSAAGWRLGVSAAAPRSARRSTRWFLDGCPDVGPDLTETAMLVVSELVTNAYAAAASLGRESLIDLSLRLGDDRLRVEVSDASPRVPVRSPWPDAITETGRGLDLVDALSGEWGYFWERDRKVVYAVLLLT